jgi:hypothetical protein
MEEEEGELHREPLKSTTTEKAFLRKRHDEAASRIKKRRAVELDKSRLRDPSAWPSCPDGRISGFLRAIAEDETIKTKELFHEMAECVLSPSQTTEVHEWKCRLLACIIRANDPGKCKDAECVKAGFGKFLCGVLESTTGTDVARCFAMQALILLTKNTARVMWETNYALVDRWILPFVEAESPKEMPLARASVCREIADAIYDILMDELVIISEKQLGRIMHAYCIMSRHFAPVNGKFATDNSAMAGDYFYVISAVVARVAMMARREYVSPMALEYCAAKAIECANVIITTPGTAFDIQAPALEMLIGCIELGGKYEMHIVCGLKLLPILLDSPLSAKSDKSKRNRLYDALLILARSRCMEILRELWRSGAIEQCIHVCMDTQMAPRLREVTLDVIEAYVIGTNETWPAISNFLREIMREEFVFGSLEFCEQLERVITNYLYRVDMHSRTCPPIATDCYLWVTVLLENIDAIMCSEGLAYSTQNHLMALRKTIDELFAGRHPAITELLLAPFPLENGEGNESLQEIE